MNPYAIEVISITITILAAVVSLVMVYRSSGMIVTFVAGVMILFAIYTPLKMIIYGNVNLIEIFDHKDFNELKNTQTEDTDIKVYPNPTYPDDKIVEFSNKMNDKK